MIYKNPHLLKYSTYIFFGDNLYRLLDFAVIPILILTDLRFCFFYAPMRKMDSEIDHVQIEVSEEKGYILVKPPKGINFWEILTAIGKLLPQDGFLDKHDIWVFEDGAVSITYEDLGVIKEYGVNHYPKNAEPQKTAIVVETNFQRALAETYINTGEEHPREIQIFSGLREAEQWISSE